MVISKIFITNKKSLNPPENRFIVYIFCIIFLLGYTFDLIFGHISNFIFAIDFLSLLTSIVVLALFSFHKIENRFAVKIQVIALLANIILSHFFNPVDNPDYAGVFLRNVIILGFLVPFYGVYCGKHHIIQIGFAFLLIYISSIIRSENQFLISSAPLLIICGILYMLALFYIFSSLEKMQNKQTQLSIDLKLYADLLKQKNDFLEQQQNQILEQTTVLKQLNDDKDVFLSILAHDLKSPFSGILGLSKLLSTNIRNYDYDKIESLAFNLNKSANHSYKLLEDLLLWAQSQSGKLPFEPQKLVFINICHEIIEMLKLNANEKNISINISADKELEVFADSDMLKTILRNLISNAIKFTNSDGLITINAKQSLSCVTVSVADNGVGIAPDILKKLFSISEKYSTSGTANEKGTGLGLLLCKEFVEKHGGKICVESKLFEGSEFTFTLPNQIK